MEETIKNIYGHKVRVRACGICVKNDSLLLVNHSGLNNNRPLWIPPGGGIKPGESATQALEREFLEETGLNIEVHNFLFLNEFIKEPLHAIELFFRVSILNGRLITGIDPETDTHHQIIKEVRFVTFSELGIMDNETLHNALHAVNSQESLLNMSGYFKFCQ